MVRHFRINLWQSWPGLITYSKNAETNTQLPRASSMKNGGHPNKFTMKGWNIAGRIRKQYIKIQQSHGFFWIKPWRDIEPFREFSSFRSRTGRDRDVIKWFRGNKSKWIALKFLCLKCFCIYVFRAIDPAYGLFKQWHTPLKIFNRIMQWRDLPTFLFVLIFCLCDSFS